MKDVAIAWLGSLNWMVLFGAILIVGSIVIFWTMAKNPKSSFDFSEMFQGDDGKTSMGKFLAFIGGFTATWVVVALATAKELTDTIFMAYLTALIVGKVASEYVAAKKIEAKDKILAGVRNDSENNEPSEPKVDLQLSVSSPAVEAERKPLGKRGPSKQGSST